MILRIELKLWQVEKEGVAEADGVKRLELPCHVHHIHHASIAPSITADSITTSLAQTC